MMFRAVDQCVYSRYMIKGEAVAMELCKHGIPWFISNCLFGPMNEGEMEKSQALMVSALDYIEMH
jgi:hypothetical protein